ncbi:hypothetical protein DRQ36_04980 [bacterium]|nr:MAG: hypothetical protein DRQ36_04980 [bacterium]
MAKRIGYLSGTDAMVLTRIAAEGIGTIPLSNGWDDHGKYIAHITPADGLSLIVAPFHKVMAAPGDPVGPKDVLTSALEAAIPILIVAPEDVQIKIRKFLKNRKVEFVTPENLLETMKSILKV